MRNNQKKTNTKTCPFLAEKCIQLEYGKVLADKMLRAKTENNGNLERDDYAELMRKHNNESEINKRSIEIKPNKPKSKYKGQFVGISFSVIKNAKLRKILKRSMLLYLYLRVFIVRKKYSGDKLNLYEKYFKKGKLAGTVWICPWTSGWLRKMRKMKRWKYFPDFKAP